MADKDVAIKRIIMVVIYYFFLFALLTFAIGMQDNIGSGSIRMNDGNIQDISALRLKGGSCEYPRETGDIFSASNQCIYSNVESEEECLLIQGCYVQTSLLSGSFCAGRINVSYYNEDEPNTGSLNKSSLIGDNICDGIVLDQSKDTCELLGCTWIDWAKLSNSQIKEYDRSPNSFLTAIGFAFGFNADIGVSGFMRIIVALLFYIPLIILVGSAYTLIPFI